ncbi:hypothetical protein JVT61DRAFT_4042 [Boletus reticuloceps]|uniref:Uncharacterized protein n=1 Tax=Boletus reticuloceps TaxID=495285 RepID=A0A8I3A943_9AGAM|nr:hypothetical protein JVT61DRAFT_4042 [Boletus reticuloceps]
MEGVVDEAVQTLSRKELEPRQPNPVEPGEATIGKLIEEAEELKGLLDRLAKRTEYGRSSTPGRLL